MTTSQQCQRLPAVFFSLVAYLGLHVAVPTLQAEVFVDDSPAESTRPAVVASDMTPARAAEVAREVLRLQQQMGGSVVRNRTGLQSWDNSSWPVTPNEAPLFSPHDDLDARRQTLPERSVNKVSELREAAWQLDTTAHRLESLDLYDQADALRDVAHRLRHDAREMKRATE